MELLEGGSICRKDLQVSYFDCDVNNRMKLSAVLRQIQQISMEHCDLLGIGEKFMDKLGMAFLLGKISVKIEKLPSATDKLVISTIPDCKPMRAQYKRCTVIRDISGNKLLEVDSRWILVDMKTKKIVRHKPDSLIFPNHEHVTFMHEMKMEKSGEELGVTKTKVSYSHLDVNNHMNNTFYADLICNAVCDTIDESPIMNRQVDRLIINYRNQILKGNIVLSYTNKCASEKDKYYISGKVEDKTCFDANISFK